MLEVSLLGAETALLRLEKDAWSVVKLLNQATSRSSVSKGMRGQWPNG